MASENFVLEEFGRSLERWGLMDVLLPFLLIFTIVFAVLEKSKILGEERRNMNSAIALIFALIIVIPHITGDLPAGYDPVLVLNAALPSVGLVAVIIVIFGSAAGWYANGFDDWLENVFGSDALAIFIMLVVFGVIISFVTGGEGEREKLAGFKRMGMDFGKLFGK